LTLLKKTEHMYDQDKMMAVSENLGEVIFVKEFVMA